MPAHNLTLSQSPTGITTTWGKTVALGKTSVAITELAKYLAVEGGACREMGIGGTILVDGVSFTMTPALHSSSVEENGTVIPVGLAAGFVIRMDGVRIYHAGYTALFSDMKPDRGSLAPRYRSPPDRGEVHYGKQPKR